MDMKTKVLIVDDEPRNVRILQEILEDLYTLDTAYNGQEALDKIVSFQPDIILLDNMMPEIDGLEVCRRIRTELNNNKVKVIMLSGRASTPEQTEGLAAGANRYITKPFSDDDLITAIDELFLDNNEAVLH